MSKKEAVQTIRPKVADGLQKVLVLFERDRDKDRASAIPMDSHVGW
jgi:hypothetical protein